MMIQSKINPHLFYYVLLIEKQNERVFFLYINSNNYYSYYEEKDVNIIDDSLDGYIFDGYYILADFMKENKELYELLDTTDDFWLLGKKIAEVFYKEDNFHYIKYKDTLAKIRGIKAKAIPIEKPWIQCPECADVFEANEFRKYLDCPKCNAALENPYFIGYYPCKTP